MILAYTSLSQTLTFRLDRRRCLDSWQGRLQPHLQTSCCASQSAPACASDYKPASSNPGPCSCVSFSLSPSFSLPSNPHLQTQRVKLPSVSLPLHFCIRCCSRPVLCPYPQHPSYSTTCSGSCPSPP